jgi:DNA-directed RNA polymerase
MLMKIFCCSHILPAFYSLYRSQGRFVKEEIKPHPILSRLFRGAVLEDLTFDVEKVPMFCPPVPWSSIKLGGHLVANTDIIR